MSTAQLPPPLSRATLSWLFFGFQGRIGREVYWLGIGLLWCVLFVAISLYVEATGQREAAGPLILLGLASLWCEMSLLVKRQHDRNLPWFWCLLAFIPIAGAVWMVVAGLIPGDRGANPFGRQANTPPA